MLYKSFVVCLLASNFIYAQVVVRGRVMDKSTNHPISYANIMIAGNKTGTSTNAEGRFIVKTKKLPVKITISHIGYLTASVTLKNADTYVNIDLVHSEVALPEFEIVHKDYGVFLVEKATEKLIRTKDSLFYGKAFYRQTTFNDSEAVEMQEIFFDMTLSPVRILNTKTVQGRYATQKDRLFRYGMKFSNFSEFTKNSSALPYNDEGELFGFMDMDSTMKAEHVRVIQANNTKIAEVRLFQDRRIAGGKKEEILLYIDMSNFLLYRIHRTSYLNYTTIDSKIQSALNQKTVFDYTFRQANDSLCLLEYFDIVHSFDLVSKYDKSYSVRIKSHTYFYESGKVKDNSQYTESDKSDLNIIDDTAYDPVFWEKNPVVERTVSEEVVIKMFNKRNYFGRIVDSK